MSQKHWRPFGYWALTLNAALGFPALVTLAILEKGTDSLGVLAGAYASVLATWAASAGIRQWGKNNGSELENVIHTGEEESRRT